MTSGRGTTHRPATGSYPKPVQPKPQPSALTASFHTRLHLLLVRSGLPTKTAHAFLFHMHATFPAHLTLNLVILKTLRAGYKLRTRDLRPLTAPSCSQSPPPCSINCWFSHSYALHMPHTSYCHVCAVLMTLKHVALPVTPALAQTRTWQQSHLRKQQEYRPRLCFLRPQFPFKISKHPCGSHCYNKMNYFKRHVSEHPQVPPSCAKVRTS